jgi:hypothetical protein
MKRPGIPFGSFAECFFPGDPYAIGESLMRRIVATGLMLALLLGLSACGGDDDEGIPKEMPASGASAVDLTKAKEKMMEKVGELRKGKH